MRPTTRTGRTALIAAVAAAALAAPPAASAALPDLQILSVQPSRATVPIGIPTKVTFVLNVRNNGEPTSGANTSIGPVGGAPTFTNVGMVAQDFGQFEVRPSTCDAPGGPAPRCHVGFLTRPQTQTVEVTDTVLATVAGPVTRSFVAEVLAPDKDGDGTNNTGAATLQAVPGQLPTFTNLAVRPASSLTARQRRIGVAKVVFDLDRAADLTITVDRRGAGGRYAFWGRFLRGAVAGANTQLINKRVDRIVDPPIHVALKPMSPGTYRLTLVATDDEGQRSKPAIRTLVVPRKR
jgi:hypothetical protein